MADSVDSLIDAAVAPLVASADSTPASAPPSTPASTDAKPSAPAAVPVSGSAPTPASSTGQPTTRASASDGKPADESDEVSADEKLKGIPHQRHQSILENARKKTETQIFSEIGYSREEMKTLRPWVDLLANDWETLHRKIGDVLKAQGRTSEAPAPVAPQQPVEEPQPDLRAEDGTLAYSAPVMRKVLQAALAAQKAELAGTMDERLKPYEGLRVTLEREQIKTAANERATELVGAVKDLPHYEALRSEMANLIKEDGRVTPQSAYNRLIGPFLNKREATLTEETRQTTLAALKAKPGLPQKSVSPSAASVGSRTPRGRQTVDDRLESAVSQFRT